MRRLAVLFTLFLYSMWIFAQSATTGTHSGHAATSSSMALRAGDELRTVSGRIIRTDNGKPIAGVTILVAPCIACDGVDGPFPPHDPIATTAADGTYLLSDVPWKHVWIYAAHSGYLMTMEGCGSCTGNPLSVDLKLQPTAIPMQMNDSVLASTDGKNRPQSFFRTAAFTPDGEALQILTEGRQGWKYNLPTKTLEPGPAIPENDSDEQIVGRYEIVEGPSCRGCGGSIVARNPKTGTEFEITDGADSVVAGSSDGKIVFWWSGRSMEVFSLSGRHTTRIPSLPSSSGFEPLAARPDGDGYLFAYAVMGPCNIDGTALVQLVEGDQAEQVAQKDPNARAQRQANVCFLHARLPAP